MDWEIIWKPFVTGYAVLIIAIILNIIAKTIGISTWYDLLNKIAKHSFNIIKHESITSLIFLLIIYPLALGLTAYFILKLI